jgi:CHAD domain-containing protein
MILDYVKLKEIKPVLSVYLKEAQSLLNLSAVPDEKAIHDIRVLMKKSRAVLKLIHSQIDDESFQRDYLALRQVGRVLCTWRETSVHRKTLKDIKKEYPDIFLQLEDNEKIMMLMKKPDSLLEVTPESRQDVEQINELLRKAAYRIRFQSMGNLIPQQLLKELEMIYDCVADNYLICRNSPKPANIHEFRKRAKDLLYQLFFFRPLNPSVIKDLEKKLDSITQFLGKYNDLSQIVTILDYKYNALQNAPALDELMVAIREQQDKYLARVWPSAHKIFCPGQKLINVLGFRLLVI